MPPIENRPARWRKTGPKKAKPEPQPGCFEEAKCGAEFN
jgi:hypothetical protein